MAVRQVVSFSLDDIQVEIRGDGNPVLSFQEKGLGEDDASDFVIFKLRRNISLSFNQSSHLEVGRCSVLFLKRMPGKAAWEDCAVGEETPTCDKIQWGMELEEEGLTGLQGFELGSSPRLPEIDLVNSRLLSEERKPLVICDADKTFHGFPKTLRGLILLSKMLF